MRSYNPEELRIAFALLLSAMTKEEKKRVEDIIRDGDPDLRARRALCATIPIAESLMGKEIDPPLTLTQIEQLPPEQLPSIDDIRSLIDK